MIIKDFPAFAFPPLRDAPAAAGQCKQTSADFLSIRSIRFTINGSATTASIRSPLRVRRI